MAYRANNFPGLSRTEGDVPKRSTTRDSIATLSTNLAIGIATALSGHFGSGAIAGYGTASRPEY
ncbi:MAG: hypothetical protein EOP02_28510, partial [Proteobacteria bacterium]